MARMIIQVMRQTTPEIPHPHRAHGCGMCIEQKWRATGLPVQADGPAFWDATWGPIVKAELDLIIGENIVIVGDDY